MEKKNYVQPEIEVLQIKIEKGFATSGGEDYGFGAGNSPWGDF